MQRRVLLVLVLATACALYLQGERAWALTSLLAAISSPAPLALPSPTLRPQRSPPQTLPPILRPPRMFAVASCLLHSETFTSNGPRIGNQLFSLRLLLAIARMSNRTLVPQRFVKKDALFREGGPAHVSKLDIFAEFFSHAAADGCAVAAGANLRRPVVLAWDDPRASLAGRNRSVGFWQFSSSKPPLLGPGRCDAELHSRASLDLDLRQLGIAPLGVAGASFGGSGTVVACVQTKDPAKAMATLEGVDLVILTATAESKTSDIGSIWAFKIMGPLQWMAPHLPSGFQNVVKDSPPPPNGRRYPECLMTPKKAFLYAARLYARGQLVVPEEGEPRYASVHIRLGDALSTVSNGGTRTEKHYLTPAATLAAFLSDALGVNTSRRLGVESGAEDRASRGPPMLFVAAEPHAAYLSLFASLLARQYSGAMRRKAGSSAIDPQRHVPTSGSDYVSFFDREWLEAAMRSAAGLDRPGGGPPYTKASSKALPPPPTTAEGRDEARAAWSAIFGEVGGEEIDPFLLDQRLMLIERTVAALATDFQAAYPTASTFGDEIRFLRRAAGRNNGDSFALDRAVESMWVSARRRACVEILEGDATFFGEGGKRRANFLPPPPFLGAALARDDAVLCPARRAAKSGAAVEELAADLAKVAVYLRAVYLGGGDFSVVPIWDGGGGGGGGSGQAHALLDAALCARGRGGLGSDAPGVNLTLDMRGAPHLLITVVATDDEASQVSMRTPPAAARGDSEKVDVGIGPAHLMGALPRKVLPMASSPGAEHAAVSWMASHGPCLIHALCLAAVGPLP